MPEEYEPLRNLIQTFSEHTKAHICVHDVAGILKLSALSLDFQNQIHSKDFCTTAKIPPKGYNLCIGCKMRANNKAINNKILFYGYCPYGLYEVVKPVIIEDKTQCIIYIGNLICDIDETLKKIRHTCAITNASEQDLLMHVKEAQRIDSIDYHSQLANLLDSYIRLLYEQCKLQKNDEKQHLHWAVSTLQHYINVNYSQIISLQSVSKLYYINDKYIGRLFKKQIGYTFHEYLNKVRLDNAITLLLYSKKSIIDIAISSGFQNVTYFNRVFVKRFNFSPTKYRIKFKENSEIQV